MDHGHIAVWLPAHVTVSFIHVRIEIERSVFMVQCMVVAAR